MTVRHGMTAVMTTVSRPVAAVMGKVPAVSCGMTTVRDAVNAVRRDMTAVIPARLSCVYSLLTGRPQGYLVPIHVCLPVEGAG